LGGGTGRVDSNDPKDKEKKKKTGTGRGKQSKTLVRKEVQPKSEKKKKDLSKKHGKEKGNFWSGEGGTQKFLPPKGKLVRYETLMYDQGQRKKVQQQKERITLRNLGRGRVLRKTEIKRWAKIKGVN